MGTCNDCRLATVSDVTNMIVNSGGAGIGFDTLSNVVIVDASFDSTTAGWGVSAFATLEVATQTVSSGTVVMVSGTVALANDVDISGLYLIGWGNSVVNCGTDNMFVTAGETATVVGITSICPVSGYEVSGDLILFDCTVTAGEFGVSVFATGTVSIDGCMITSTSGLKPCVLVASGGVVNHVYKSHLLATTAAFNFIGGSTAVDVEHSTMTGSLTNATIDPLNHSNLVDGATYFEIVTVASLPVAGIVGRTAATSDGGTGSIPALMFDNGSAWVVAAE